MPCAKSCVSCSTPFRCGGCDYRNGLAAGPHTLKVVARKAQNPYARGTRVYLDGLQFSTATGAHHFPSGQGPTET